MLDPIEHNGFYYIFSDIICDTGMIDQLVGHLSEEHTMFHEHLLSALLTIVRNHSRSIQQCLRPELNLVPLLQQKEQDLKGKQQFLVYSFTAYCLIKIFSAFLSLPSCFNQLERSNVLLN